MISADLETQYPSIKNAPLPADGPGNDSFPLTLLFAVLGGVPLWLSWKLGGGLKTTIFFAILAFVPLLSSFWLVVSAISPRRNEKARFPGRPVEHYLTFKKPADKAKYQGRNKIPMETFYEMYFDGDVEFNGDCLEVMEYRHEWASFRFTIGLIKYFMLGMIPELIMHTRSQGTCLRPLTAGFFAFSLTVSDVSILQTRSKSATIMTAVTISTPGSSAHA